MVSCGSSKKIVTNPNGNQQPNTSTSTTSEPTIADKVVWTAVTYKGVPYKYAGTTKVGMDCSGLIYTSFKQRDVSIPRTSALMYETGVPIRLNEVRRGDLLFFKTSRKRGRVNHVGLVTSAENGDIRFIHSTSSRGVIVTSLSNKYWNDAFIEAKRVL